MTTTAALEALRNAFTAPPEAPVTTLADKVAVIELYSPSETLGWAIGVDRSLGRVWRVNPAHVTLIVSSLGDLELARAVVRERDAARKWLRSLVVEEALALGLKRGPFLRPALTAKQLERHAEDAADERRWSRAD